MKGWKLESLLNWVKEESIAIIEITETNMAERERNFLVGYAIPKADEVSSNKSIYVTKQQDCHEKALTKNHRSCFQKEKTDANSHHR
ncbi:46356_t:CDS:2 [Gigaspora margarita]|uniref:46356_t:CDS:1 n=1 Tax=Gigaspora margarita TaxID=4874 RepID=A0ABN7W1U9_GIGMA|nr:46356_t:CDS:2 [Gigaspora margarita]